MTRDEEKEVERQLTPELPGFFVCNATIASKIAKKNTGKMGFGSLAGHVGASRVSCKKALFGAWHQIENF